MREPGVAAPLVDGCVAGMATRVIDEPDLAARYDLFVVEGTAAWVDDRVFTDRRLRDTIPDALRTVHHVAGGVYVVDGAIVRTRA